MYNEKRIYTKYVNCRLLPNATTKTFDLNLPEGFCWVDESNSYIYSEAQSLKNVVFPLTYNNQNTGSAITYSLNEEKKQITFIAKDNWSSYNAFVAIKYYKHG